MGWRDRVVENILELRVTDEIVCIVVSHGEECVYLIPVSAYSEPPQSVHYLVSMVTGRGGVSAGVVGSMEAERPLPRFYVNGGKGELVL